MASSAMSSSSKTLARVSSFSFGSNSMPLMENLFSTTQGSDASLRGEMEKTAETLSQFMKQTNEQLQAANQRCLALEGKLVAAEGARNEAIRVNEALKQSVRDLTATVMSMNAELANLKSSVAKVNALEKNFKAHTHPYTYTHTPPGGLAMPIGQSSTTGLAKY